MNPTQVAGILAFAGAALVCFRVRWWLIGTINATLALECLFGIRHRIHDLAVKAMGPLYADRADFQIGLIGFSLTLFAGSAILLLGRKQRSAPRLVTAATLLAIALFSIEIISLHDIDAMLYRHVGGVMVIGWMWLALGLSTVIGAMTQKTSNE